MRKDFGWPGVTGGSTGGSSPELWIPGAARDIPRTPADNPAENLSGDRNLGILRMVARLRDGVTLEQARREADVLAARLAEEYPDSDASRGAAIVPLREQFFGPVTPPARSAAGGGRDSSWRSRARTSRACCSAGHVATPRNRRPSCARRDPRAGSFASCSPKRSSSRSPAASRGCGWRRGRPGAGRDWAPGGVLRLSDTHADPSFSRFTLGRRDCDRPRVRSAAGAGRCRGPRRTTTCATAAPAAPTPRRAGGCETCWSRSRSPSRWCCSSAPVSCCGASARSPPSTPASTCAIY